MTKQEFLKELKAALSPIGNTERQQSLDYYSEMIDDRIEEGLSEEDAVLALGPITEIYRNILFNQTNTKTNDKIQQSAAKKATKSILIFFGLLVFGLPILASLFAVAVSVLAAIWSVVISLWAATIALSVTGLVGTVLFFPTVFSGMTLKAIFILGVSIFSIGLVYPFFYISRAATKFAIIASKKIYFLFIKLL